MKLLITVLLLAPLPATALGNYSSARQQASVFEVDTATEVPAVPVPEPGAGLMFATGVLALLVYRKIKTNGEEE